MIASASLHQDRASPTADGNELLHRLQTRCPRFDTLPAVAAELLQHTGDPRIGVADLEACIERDPALTAKILRVVNSSLYGPAVEVDNLGHAADLLGIKPLELLALGLSLPDELLAELAGEQRAPYWSTAIVRAVAAKAIAERFYRHDGDDAFLAGLIDDLGMLVMLDQLGRPYAQFLQVAWDEEADVRRLERQILGFDHSQLTAALLAQWNMPQALVSAVVAEPRRLHTPSADHTLARTLYLANLTAALVGRHRLDVLPELLESGTEFCGLDMPALGALVAELEPKVSNLAEAMDVPLPRGTGYLQILADARARLAGSDGNVATPRARLNRAGELLAQLKNDWSRKKPCVSAGLHPVDPIATPLGEPGGSSSPGRPLPRRRGALMAALQRAVAECRASRDELSLVLLGASEQSAAGQMPPQSALFHAGELLRRACREAGVVHAAQWPFSQSASAVILPHCSGKQAMEMLRRVRPTLAEGASRPKLPEPPLVRAGVASVDSPPRDFDAARLLNAAQRCLLAAEASGGRIKSIELY